MLRKCGDIAFVVEMGGHLCYTTNNIKNLLRKCERMNINQEKRLGYSLIPDHVNPSPDYYCTWQTQLYATCDGKPQKQRAAMHEQALFDKEKPYGWAYFYESARQDLFLVMDDSWDVPPTGASEFYGSLVPDPEKFPSFTSPETVPQEAMKRLCDHVKSLGWKGLGGWICAQESPLYTGNLTKEEYWTKRLQWAAYAGMSYWKVDWGNRSQEYEFRRGLPQLARTYAPELIVENSMRKDVIPFSDVFRTYDVPAIMSIPMTLEKLRDLTDISSPLENFKGLINCEDEVYIAAAGGFTMGVMRHPYAGPFPDGRADMSFPDLHRRLKTKMTEVTRAAHWHRIAPAFGAEGSKMHFSQTRLTDTWKLKCREEEIESWWPSAMASRNYMQEDTLTVSACASLGRCMAPPTVVPDSDGLVPFTVASRNPNGAVSVATLGRTLGRTYKIPRCDVTLDTGNALTFGIFGQYRNLILHTELDLANCRIAAQDLAYETAYDITTYVNITGHTLIIPGTVIDAIGTMAQNDADTSEPGLILTIQQKENIA